MVLGHPPPWNLGLLKMEQKKNRQFIMYLSTYLPPWIVFYNTLQTFTRITIVRKLFQWEYRMKLKYRVVREECWNALGVCVLRASYVALSLWPIINDSILKFSYFRAPQSKTRKLFQYQNPMKKFNIFIH